MSQKLSVNNQCNKDFKKKKNYNEQNHERYFLEIDVQYAEKVHDVHNDLRFFTSKNED